MNTVNRISRDVLRVLTCVCVLVHVCVAIIVYVHLLAHFNSVLPISEGPNRRQGSPEAAAAMCNVTLTLSLSTVGF